MIKSNRIISYLYHVFLSSQKLPFTQTLVGLHASTALQQKKKKPNNLQTPSV